MGHHHQNEMEAGIERRENAKLVPDAYGVKEGALGELKTALAELSEYEDDDGNLPENVIFWFRLAMNADGTRTGYYEITVGEVSVYCGNDVFACPPFCCPPFCG